MIAPPAFASYFGELAALVAAHGAPDPAALTALAGRYSVEFDLAAMGPLLERHGLRLG